MALKLPKYQTIKKLMKNQQLISLAFEKFKDIDISLEEKVFLFTLGQEHPPKCKCGNNLKFNKNTSRYQNYCGTQCLERKKETSNKVKNTNLSKYGVTNPLQNTEIIERIKKTNLERYGTSNPAQNKNIREKIEKTNFERYGFKTNLLNNKFKEEIKKIHNNKYGFDSHLKNQEIRHKIIKTNKERYGFNTPAQNNQIKEKIKKTNLKKYGSEYSSQKMIPTQVLEILNNKEKFLNLYTQHKNTRSLATELDLHSTTILNYLHKYEIDIFHYRSNYETEISSFLTDLNIPHILNDRKKINPLEIDILVEDFNLGIEIHGLYWHSEARQNNIEYHHLKYKKSEEKGIFLFQFFENEIRDKKRIIFSMIKNKINLNQTKIGARKTHIEEISNKTLSEFLEKNHIQGKSTLSKIRYGAFYKNELVGVCSFQPKKDLYELTRFCTKTDTNIPGLFSKIVKTFIKNYKPKKIISFSDNRYSNGNLYSQNGWQLEEELLPVHYYTDLQNLYHRFLFRKNNLKRKYNIDIENKTESQLYKELGFLKIWDAGKKKWVLDLR